MAMDHDEADTCWICLEGGDDLVAPCNCPRVVHRNCMAKWQLHKAGTAEETNCRFCSSELKSWKTELFPPVEPTANSRPVMRFCLNGQVFYIVPKSGPDGLSEFKDTVRKLCNLSDDTQLDLSFQCSDPTNGLNPNGSQLNLEGDGAYDAAVHCATIWAEARGGDLPRNVIDTANPDSLANYRQASDRRVGETSRTLPGIHRVASTGGNMRRSHSSHNIERTSPDGEPTGRVRFPDIFRGFQKKISGLTQRSILGRSNQAVSS